MEGREIRIPVGAASITASVYGTGRTVVALGHGAGGDRKTPFLMRGAEGLASSGRGVVLYNFPYTDARRRAPDPPDVLEATARAVADHARAALGGREVGLGGKTKGGRAEAQ